MGGEGEGHLDDDGEGACEASQLGRRWRIGGMTEIGSDEEEFLDPLSLI